MATRATISELKEHVDEEVTLFGWLYNRRSSGKIRFVEVRDGTGIVQCVAFDKELTPEEFELCDSIPYESTVRLTGTVRLDERAPGGVELGLTSIKMVSEAEEYPIALQSGHGPDFLLSNRHLWLRSQKQHAVMNVRHETIRAIRNFFDDRGFINVDAPILTPNACEGTTTLFELEYFDQGNAYLTQSGQLYMEAAAAAFGKAYCFGPTFRAEKSKTRRHLTEFWMVEPEVAFADLDDVMDLAEEFVCAIVGHVIEHCAEHLETLDRDLSVLTQVQKPFPRITYDEAVDIIRSSGREFDWGDDFGAPDETIVSEAFDRPVMIHRYPAQVKAFYMKRDPENDRVALCVDVIAPEGVGEIIGGGQRADDLAYLEEQIEAHDLPKEAFEWYLDLRRYGTFEHGGFGLGLERTVAWLCGREHVREAIPFPRMLYRIYP